MKKTLTNTQNSDGTKQLYNSGNESENRWVEEIIGALKMKYPDGPMFETVAELVEDNPVFACELKTMNSRSRKLFGMPLGRYLVENGLLIDRSIVVKKAKEEKKNAKLAKEMLKENEKRARELLKENEKLEQEQLKEENAKARMTFREMIIQKYGIDFIGTTFVLSGPESALKKEIANIITERGGFCRKSISGKTDYLIYDSYYTSKYREANRRKRKGQNIKLITFEQFLDYTIQYDLLWKNSDIEAEYEKNNIENVPVNIPQPFDKKVLMKKLVEDRWYIDTVSVPADYEWENKAEAFRLYIRFGNKESWKKFLKLFALQYENNRDCLWFFMGNKGASYKYFDGGVDINSNELSCVIKAFGTEESSEQMFRNICEFVDGSGMVLADYKLSPTKLIRYYSIGGEVHMLSADYFKGNDDMNAFYNVRRWLGDELWMELTDGERQFGHAVEREQLPEYKWEDDVQENAIKVRFESEIEDCAECCIYAGTYYRDLNDRLKTSSYTENEIYFKDLCVTTGLAKYLAIQFSYLIERTSKSGIFVEFIGNRDEDKGRRMELNIRFNSEEILTLFLVEYENGVKTFDDKKEFRICAKDEQYEFVMHEKNPLSWDGVVENAMKRYSEYVDCNDVI